MTLSIELIGVLILCLWIIIPIGEYRTIYRRLRKERSHKTSGQGEART